MSQSVVKNPRKLFSFFSQAGGSASSVWGSITGLLSNQTDLQSALNNKLDTTATTANVNPSTDRNYITDLMLFILGNTSNTNTGDETKSTIITKLQLITGNVNIDFGLDGELSENDLVITTIPNLNVLSTTKFICLVENDGTDHDEEDAQLENIIANVINIVPNASFDIITVAHNLTWGRYKITYKEII